MNALQQEFGGGAVFKYTFDRIDHIGIENLRARSDFAFDTDEDHAWSFIELRGVQDAWVRNITGQHFGYATVWAGPASRRVTVDDAQSLDPKSTVTGQRRYAFLIEGQSILMRNLYSENSRHDFINNAWFYNRGPNVFLDARAINSFWDSGPHQRWATGTLYDTVTVADALINARNRFNFGVGGHGWSGAQFVIWNSTAEAFIVQNPPTGMNWLIGGTGPILDDLTFGPQPPGIYDSHGQPIDFNDPDNPTNSLYIAQLLQRLSTPRLEQRVYVLGDFDFGEYDGENSADDIFVDPQWLSAVDPLVNGAPLRPSDSEVAGHFVAGSFLFELSPQEAVHAATLTLGIRGTSLTSLNTSLWLDGLDFSIALAGLGTSGQFSTGDTVPVVIELAGANLTALQDGQLNLLLGLDVILDWAVLETHVGDPAGYSALTLSVAAPRIGEADGESATRATVSRNFNLSVPLDVMLISEDQGEATVIGHVTIPAGQVSTDFFINAIDDDELDGTQTVRIIASADEFLSGVAAVDVDDDDLPWGDIETTTFDFSRTLSANAQNAYSVLQTQQHSPQAGYGWTDLDGIAASDSGPVGTDSIRRDSHYFPVTSDAREFRINVLNGVYDVTLLIGSSYFPFLRQRATLNGHFLGEFVTAKGEFSETRHQLQVVDGSIRLLLEQQAGVFGIAGLLITRKTELANAAPQLAWSNALRVVPETIDLSRRQLVGTLSLIDDGVGNNRLAITGPDASLFELDGLDLYLRAGQTLDAVYHPHLNVVVTVDDASIGTDIEDSATLEISVILTPLFEATFDFNRTSSAVADGAISVLADRQYTLLPGFGWTNLDGIAASDSGSVTTDALRRDSHYFPGSTTSREFRVDVPNGYYEVTVAIGSMHFPFAGQRLSINGQAADTIATAKEEFVERTYQVEVVDGSIRLLLEQQVGVYGIAGLAIRQKYHKTFDFSRVASAVANDFVAVLRDRLYAPLPGFGWTNLDGIAASDSGSVTTDALRRDSHYFPGSTASREFRVDLPNGLYKVTVIVGSMHFPFGGQRLSINGQPVGTIATAREEFVERTYQVEVVDGSIRLLLEQQVGVYGIAGLIIEE